MDAGARGGVPVRPRNSASLTRTGGDSTTCATAVLSGSKASWCATEIATKGTSEIFEIAVAQFGMAVSEEQPIVQSSHDESSPESLQQPGHWTRPARSIAQYDDAGIQQTMSRKAAVILKARIGTNLEGTAATSQCALCYFLSQQHWSHVSSVNQSEGKTTTISLS
jgi:hypothetical protein